MNNHRASVLFDPHYFEKKSKQGGQKSAKDIFTSM